MAADLRLRDNAYWRERWAKAFRAYGLGEEEREDLGPTEADLTDLEESVRALETWNGNWSTLVELVEALHGNGMLYPLLRKQEGAVRNRLITLARHVLEVTPLEQWLMSRYRRQREDGLESLLYSPIGEGIVAWEQLRASELGLTLEISLALFLLSSLDEVAFFNWLDFAGHPLKRKIAADWHADDADLGVTLAGSRSQTSASLGIYHALHYLTLLEAHGQKPLQELDAYTYNDAELETAVSHRQVVRRELEKAVESLVSAVAQAGHGFLLGQMLGLAVRPPSQYTGASVQKALMDKVPPALAASLTDLSEDEIWRGIRSVSDSGEIAERVAAVAPPEAGLRWRERIKARLDTLLSVSEGSETKPVHFRTEYQQSVFLDNISCCLYSLEKERSFDLLPWFEPHFSTLEPFRDRWEDLSWEHRSSRAALLMMIGGALSAIYPEHPAREKLNEMLTNQLSRHLPAWQWQKVFIQADASFSSRPLEAQAVIVLGVLPTSARKNVYADLRSIWVGSCLADEQLKDKVQALAQYYLAGELPDLSSPMLGRLTKVFIQLSLWDEAEKVLTWWRTKDGLTTGTYYPSDALDLFDALINLGRDEVAGTFELEQFARHCEHMRAQPHLYKAALTALSARDPEKWGTNLEKLERYLAAVDA